MREKAIVVHEYDMYLAIFNHHRGKQVGLSHEKLQAIEEAKSSIPNLTELLGASLKHKFTM